MKHIVPLAALAFIVAGFAYFTLFAGPSIEDAVQDAEQPVKPKVADEPKLVPKRESFSGEGSLYSLLTRGDNLECAITYIPNPLEAELNGNIFTFEGDLRGDFVVPTPDLAGEMVTSVIIADKTVWQWTDIGGDVVGSIQKVNYETASLERLVAPIGFVNEVQYKCLTWPQVDYTIFEAPAGVLFTDAETTSFEEGTLYPEGEF